MVRQRTVDDEEEAGGGERLRGRRSSSREAGAGVDADVRRNRRRSLLARETDWTAGVDCVAHGDEEGDGSAKRESHSSGVSDSEVVSSSSQSSPSVHGLSSRLGSGRGAKRMRGWRKDTDTDEDDDEDGEDANMLSSKAGRSRIDGGAGVLPVEEEAI